VCVYVYVHILFHKKKTNNITRRQESILGLYVHTSHCKRWSNLPLTSVERQQTTSSPSSNTSSSNLESETPSSLNPLISIPTAPPLFWWTVKPQDSCLFSRLSRVEFMGSFFFSLSLLSLNSLIFFSRWFM